MLDYNGGAFYRLKDEREAVLALVRLSRCNDEHDSTRRLMAAKFASLSEGVALQSLAPYGYSSQSSHYFEHETTLVPLIRNTANGAIETFVSWIGSLDQPQPAMKTTKGKWTDKRKAEKLKLLVQAGYHERQGRFTDTHQMCRHGLRMAIAATGSVAVKVTAYPNEKKVSKELHDTLSMFFDYGELEHNGFITLGEKTWFDPERLMEIHPGFDDLITRNMKAPPQEHNILGSTGKVKKLVCLYEGWRCTTAERCGVYLAGLEDGTCLTRDEYDYPTPPFAWLVVNPRLWGPLGQPMTHYIYESCKRDNMILATIDRSVMKTPKQQTYAELNNLDVPGSLDMVEDNQVIGIKDQSKPPHVVSALGFHPGHLELANQHRADAFQDSGIPEGKAGSKAEDGVPSAIGQRNIGAFLNKRFAATQTDYVQWVAVDIAELEIRAMRVLAKSDPKFARKWPGKKFLLEVDADVLDLDDSKYSIQVEAEGGQVSSPAGRSQAALELKQMNILSDEGYAAATQDYDTPGAIDRITAQTEWLDEQMYNWCFASDEEAADPEFYKSPIKFIGLEQAVQRVVDGLVQAQMDELEPERQEYFLLFLADLDAALKAKAAYVKSLQAAAAPAPAAPQVSAAAQAPQSLTQ